MNDISSQNTHKTYDSVISTAKIIQAKKETGGTAFGAELLAQSSNLESANQATKLLKASTNTTADIVNINSTLERNLNRLKFASENVSV